MLQLKLQILIIFLLQSRVTLKLFS